MLKNGSYTSISDKFINSPENRDNISHVHITKPFAGDFIDFPVSLHPSLIQILQENGISKLYSHQFQAIELIYQGKNVVITTGPSSGKSLVFLLPILNSLFNDENANSLLLFPTKALAYDQYNHIEKFLTSIGNKVDLQKKINVYDGDTPKEKRSQLRKNSKMILTNPDMLHIGILPNHFLWENFFENLKYVVLDEAHIYHGIFGSHVANVIRRLKRILSFYNKKPLFISTSATIGNPVELMESLAEEDFIHLNLDGSPKGRKNIIFYNPPIINQDLGIRKSCHEETLRIVRDLNENKVQTLVFQISRKEVERSLKSLSITNSEFSDNLAAAYRSGYLAEDRRNLEENFRKGKIKTLFSTNALELGVDIGGLRSVVLAGYPGSISSTLQQIGRAGRDQAEALAIMVASANPTDQYIINRPEYLFINNPEKALINPDNQLILSEHLILSIAEMTFIEGENFGKLEWNQIKEIIELLEKQGIIRKNRNKYSFNQQNQTKSFSLRNLSGNTLKLINITGDNNKIIGEIDYASSLWMVHPNAIYLHLGEQFRVKELNFENHEVLLEENTSDYYTEPKNEKTYEIIQPVENLNIGNLNLSYGKIKVTRKVVGYKEILWEKRQNIGEYELDLPEIILDTEAFWFSIPDSIKDKLIKEDKWLNYQNDYGPGWKEYSKLIRKRDYFTCQNCGAVEEHKSFHVHHKKPVKLFESIIEANTPSNLITLCPLCHRLAETGVLIRSGMAGLSYLLRTLSPIFIMCGPEDIDVILDSNKDVTGQENSIIIYDNISFGLGLSKDIYKNFNLVLPEMLMHVRQCGCHQGCPSCVGAASENGYGGKEETIKLLELLIGFIDGSKL